MPIAMTQNPEKNYLMATVSGFVTIEDFCEQATNIIENPSVKSNVNVIWDIRDIDIKCFNTSLLQDLLQYRSQIDKQRAGARLAIIASEDLHFGMGRLYESLSEKGYMQQVHVFRTFEEADAWINYRD